MADPTHGVKGAQDSCRGLRKKDWVAASHPGPHSLSNGRENRPVIMCQPCWGKGLLHPWLGGFEGVIDLLAAVGQAVALVVLVA